MSIYPIQISLLVAILWAISPIIHKYVFNRTKISPTTMLVITSPLYFTFVIVYAWFNRKIIIKDLPRLDRYAIGWLAVNTLLGAFLANVLYYVALQHNDSYIVTTIMYSSPIFVFLFAMVFLNERVSWISILGVILTVIGILLIAYHSKLSASKK